MELDNLGKRFILDNVELRAQLLKAAESCIDRNQLLKAHGVSPAVFRAYAARDPVFVKKIDTRIQQNLFTLQQKVFREAAYGVTKVAVNRLGDIVEYVESNPELTYKVLSKYEAKETEQEAIYEQRVTKFTDLSEEAQKLVEKLYLRQQSATLEAEDIAEISNFSEESALILDLLDLTPIEQKAQETLDRLR